jgi:alpha-glucosidase
VPLPWSRTGASFGFSVDVADPAAPWLPQPANWGGYSVEAQLADPGSFFDLYRAALRLRREHPALGRGALRWLDQPGDRQAAGLLCFAREPGFIFAANLDASPAEIPAHQAILLASEPDPLDSEGRLRPDTAVWLSA